MQSTLTTRSVDALLALACCCSLVAQEPVHEVLSTTLPGFPQNDVPGYPGIHFFESTSFPWERTYLAVGPNGNYALMAATDDFYGVSRVLLVDGEVVLEEGGPAPWTAGEQVMLSNASVAMNRGGKLGLLCYTNGPAASDGYLVTYDGGWTIQAQEGGAVAAVPGATYSAFTTVSALAIDDAGQLGFRASIAGAAFNNGLFHGAYVLVRANLDAPTGQLSGNNDVYTAFERGQEVRLSPDGSRWATLAYLTYPMVMAVDNAVVVQENYAIPGSGSGTLAWDVLELDFDGANRWYGLGRWLPTNSNARWAVRDGSIMARTGDETYPGSGFDWAERIEFVTGDAAGNSYVGGDYSLPPYGIGSTIVKNGTTPLLESGYVIDMNGDGVFDESVTMVLVEPAGFATNDGSLYTVIRAHDSVTNKYGSVFLRIGPPRPVLELLNLVAGQTAELKVSLAAPGDRVFTGYSLAGAGPSVVSSPWGLLSVALSPPFNPLPPMTAGPSGSASYSAMVPAGAAGVQVWAHAAVVHGTRATLTLPVSAIVG